MTTGLKDAWSNSFKVGAAVNRVVLEHKESEEIIKRHFNSLTADNSMKPGNIQPKENHFDFEEADFIANFARRLNLTMRGHTFVWHNQNPKWLFLDNNETVSKVKLFSRLEKHIFTVTERYTDIVNSWDVLNEVIDTDKGDENNMRVTDWYKIGGKEVYEFAFKCMRQACPNAKLFYNDYNNESGSKMEANIRFLSSMLDAGIPIDGVGLQGHWYFNFPDPQTLRNALERYSSLGLDIEFTEVDISCYEWPEAREESQFFKSKPEDRIKEQAKRFMEIFTVAAGFPSVKNITTWGIADNHTWLDEFPVMGRKNWPLLFDEQFKEKAVVALLIEAGNKQ
jgi:endo-1,4-beta-xylanase